MSDAALENLQLSYRNRIETVLDRCLPGTDAPPQDLHEAMRYASLNGGKRFRAMLVYAAGKIAGADEDDLDAAACAVELVHAYSLIHDDLPAMDNDELRRGKPACHIAYGEATAILAGDSLLTLAFGVLAKNSHAPGDARRRLRMIERLAVAAGTEGMTGGQSFDLAAAGRHLSLDGLEQVHRRKTGALIQASVQLGALAGDADEVTLRSLDKYAEHIGVAFQIVDDILDEVSDTSTLGKVSGSDRARNKPTYPSIIGLDASRRLVEDYYRRAIECLDNLPENAYTLRSLANMVVHRNY